jgi:hypothetical protein
VSSLKYAAKRNQLVLLELTDAIVWRGAHPSGAVFPMNGDCYSSTYMYQTLKILDINLHSMRTIVYLSLSPSSKRPPHGRNGIVPLLKFMVSVEEK